MKAKWYKLGFPRRVPDRFKIIHICIRKRVGETAYKYLQCVIIGDVNYFDSSLWFCLKGRLCNNELFKAASLEGRNADTATKGSF